MKYIEENQEALIKLTDTLCRIPAPSHHEEKRAGFVKDWLEKNGCYGVYIDEAFNVVYPFCCKEKEEVVVFAAHMDTVFPDREPFDVVYDGDLMCCPGVGDNTANLATLLLLAVWFTKSGRTPKQGILFVGDTGEEGLGNLKGVRRLMENYAGRISEFIAVDGTYSAIVSDSVGSLRYRIGIHTEGGHSYAKFGNLNAIQVLSSMIQTLYTYKTPKEGKNTYNVGTVTGGTSVNTIAQYAEMRFEYRSDSREALGAMNRFFQAVIEGYRQMDHVTVECELLGERPCSDIAGDSGQTALIERAQRIIEELTGSRVPCLARSTDSNIPLSLGVPSVCFGANLGVGAHTREEYLNIKELRLGMTILGAFMETYF